MRQDGRRDGHGKIPATAIFSFPHPRGFPGGINMLLSNHIIWTRRALLQYHLLHSNDKEELIHYPIKQMISSFGGVQLLKPMTVLYGWHAVSIVLFGDCVS